jgi:hypothetical protein
MPLTQHLAMLGAQSAPEHCRHAASNSPQDSFCTVIAATVPAASGATAPVARHACCGSSGHLGTPRMAWHRPATEAIPLPSDREAISGEALT